MDNQEQNTATVPGNNQAQEPEQGISDENKCIVLRMNKEFMARKREMKASTSVVYAGVLAENDGNWSMEI